MVPDLTTWATVQTRLGLEAGQQSAVETLIGIASKRADTFTGRTLGAADHATIVDGTGAVELRVPHHPIVSVTDVRIDASWEFGADTVVTDYTSDLAAGLFLRRAGWTRGVRNIRATYRAGYEIDAVPADLEESIVKLIGYWLNSPEVSWLDAQTGGGVDQVGVNYVGVMDLPFQIRHLWASYREVHV